MLRKETDLLQRSEHSDASLKKDALTRSIEIIENLSKKHNLRVSQIIELLDKKEKYVSVPIGLFRSQLSPLESLVRYLKDMHELSFVKIASILSRDETTIWTTYNNSLHKSENVLIDFNLSDINFRKLNITREDLILPVSMFGDRTLSILESLCFHLKCNLGLSYRNIASIIDRNERTVWTVVNRAKKKSK